MPDAPATDALFLSPHLDDVAFSCAGVLRDHRSRGEQTLVVTVFGGAPPPDLPIRALHRTVARTEPVSWRDLHRLWAARVDEDRAAMAVLDSAFHHLGFGDAVFRGGIERWSQVWSREPGDAERLAPEVEAAGLEQWRACGQPPVYAPLGVGHHIDHLLCWRLAEALERAGARVWYYEDFPYAARGDALEQRLGAVGGGLRPLLVDVTRHQATRVGAARCYRSQVGSFGSPERVAPLLAAFAEARAVAPGGYGERLWRRW